MMQLRSKHVGALVGFLFAWLIIQYDLFRAVFILALAVVGWFVGRILDGEIHLPLSVGRRDDDELQ